jgi:integrase
MEATMKQAESSQRQLSDRQRYELGRSRRWKTSETGISYMLSSDLKRRYVYYYEGTYHEAGSSMTEAKAFKAEIGAKKNRGERVIVPPKKLFKEVAEEWFGSPPVQRLRATTLGDYRSYLDRFILPKFGERWIASITPNEIIAFVSELREAKKANGEKRSESSVANICKPLGGRRMMGGQMGSVSGIFAYAVQERWIGSNPMLDLMAGIRPTSAGKREHHEWTKEEVDAVIKAAYKTTDYGLAVELLLRTGMRLGEVLGLKVGDIDFEGGALRVRRSVNKVGDLVPVKTEAGQDRLVPLLPELAQRILDRSLEVVLADDDFALAEAPGGKPPFQSTIRRRAWIPALKAAGLPEDAKITPHDSRHGFASQVAAAGLSAKDAAALLGHADERVTIGIYTHAFGDERAERLARQRAAMERAQSE